MKRAFLYGDLVFETIAVRQGVVCYAEKHVRRLNKGFELLQMDMKVDEAVIHSMISKALSNRMDARIRLTAYRDADGFYRPSSHAVAFETEVFELPAIKQSIQMLGLYEANLKSCNPVSEVKTGNAIISVLAAIDAQKKGVEDVIILNEHSRLCETIASNLFWVSDHTVYTPAIGEGCVKGVMREVVLEKLRHMNIPVSEGAFEVSSLEDAEEIFLSNTLHQVVSVSGYREKNLDTSVANLLRNNIQPC